MEVKPSEKEPVKVTTEPTKTKNLPKSLATSTVLIVVIYLIAWIMNTVWNYHFNLSQLLDLYYVLIGKDVAVHGINSAFNSKRGEMPANDKYNKL